MFRICLGTDGKFHCHFEEDLQQDPGVLHWVRLKEGQKHRLHPGDVFRIGKLEFSVLR